MAIQTARNKVKPRTEDTTPVLDIKLPTHFEEMEGVKDNGLTKSVFDQMLDRKYKTSMSELSKEVKSIHDRMVEYDKRMNPTANIESPEIGADNQIYLFNTIMRALSQQGNDLFIAIDIIILHMLESLDSTFSPRLAYRFLRNIKRDPQDIAAFTAFYRILLSLAPITTRSSIANSLQTKNAIGGVDQRYKEATFAMVRYLSQFRAK